MKRTIFYCILLAIFCACNDRNTPDHPSGGGGTNPPAQQMSVSFTYKRISPLMFEFTNTSTGCDSYKWDFGDGTWSEGKDALRAYSTTGTYTVTLTGMSDSKKEYARKTINVTTPKVYFAGYTLYSIPYNNKYYRLIFKDDNLLPSSWDFSTVYTPLLSSSDMPYTKVWSAPMELENIDSHTYYSIQVMRNTSTNNSSGDVQCMKQKLKVSDIKTDYRDEYILQTETGATAVGILMEYRY